MRCGCYLLIAAIGLIVYGGQGIYEGVVHGKQKTVAYEQFVKERPRQGWYKITGCVAVVPDCAFKKSGGSIEQVYVPIYGARSEEDEKETFLILDTKDPQIIEQARQLMALDSENTKEEAFIAHLKKNQEKLFLKRDLEGMVEFGVGEDSKTRDKLAGLNKELAKDFVLLEEGAKPSMLRGIGMLVGGLVLLGLIVVMWGGGNKDSQEGSGE